MNRPRALRPGDTIGLVSPASPVRPDQIEAGVALLEGAGYRVRVFPHAFDHDGYLAGRDEDRAADLMAAFDDPDIAGIWATRGGYGCVRLLPFLDLDRMAASGKLFAGFSDVTTLHLALNRRGLATLHAPMALSFSVDRAEWVRESFLRALEGDTEPHPAAPAARTLHPGKAQGTLTGGCLCLLTDSLATPDALDAEGKILLIEDVDEAPHRVDAMLTHLRRAGILERTAGIVIGEMTRTDERIDEGIGGKPWEKIVSERLEGIPVPAVIGYPFGHGRAMLSLWLGLPMRLDASQGRLFSLA